MATNLVNEKYNKAIPILKEKFGINNAMALPRITKVIINTGIGKLLSQKGIDEDKMIAAIAEDLSRICGQRPETRYARKDIANFKLRQGAPSGLRITLRGKRRNDFITRLINVDLPRMRDFKGIRFSSVDKEGNLNLGISEQIIFPEVSPESIRLIFGFSITIVTNTANRDRAIELFKLLGFPFEKKE